MIRAVVSSALSVLVLAGCFGNAGDHAVPVLDSTAHQIPTLAEAPKLDRQALLGEWDKATTIRGVFSIRDGTPAAGEYPFELRLGHDDGWLFAYAVVHDVPPNPFNGMTNADHSDKHGFSFNMFFDSQLGNDLKGPEDWKGFINLREYGTTTNDGYLDGSKWIPQNEGADPQNKPWDGDRPTSGTWGRGWFEASDLHWEIYIPLKSTNKEHDGFQVGQGAIFRMSLMFEVQGGNSPAKRDVIDGPRDVYPGDGYTPNNYYDPSTWMRLQLA